MHVINHTEPVVLERAMRTAPDSGSTSCARQGTLLWMPQPRAPTCAQRSPRTLSFGRARSRLGLGLSSTSTRSPTPNHPIQRFSERVGAARLGSGGCQCHPSSSARAHPLALPARPVTSVATRDSGSCGWPRWWHGGFGDVARLMGVEPDQCRASRMTTRGIPPETASVSATLVKPACSKSVRVPT